MTRLLLLLAVAALGLAPALSAQSLVSDPNCRTNSISGPLPDIPASQPNGHIAWPADDPLWEFDFVRPANSITADGTGLEIRNVHYNGRLVMNRGNVPVLNVEYLRTPVDQSCSCYRDWQDREVAFDVEPGSTLPGTTCIAESSPGSVVTTCERNQSEPCTNNPGNTNCGDGNWSFNGVAVEDYGDELVLTMNTSAGWYRYRMKWHFYLDGRIWPEYSFSANSAVCTEESHNHHAYWRFDFDLEGTPTNDIVREHNAAGDEILFTEEADRTWGSDKSGTYWSVVDAESNLGYKIIPSTEDLKLPVDAFSKTDALILRYDPFEMDDYSRACAIDYSTPFSHQGTTYPALQNGESIQGEDIVFWYRSSALHPGGNPWECDIVGPTLQPFDITVSNEPGGPTGEFKLDTAGPNPFTPYTTVRFRVPEAQSVRLSLYDALGREVQTLFEGDIAADRDETVRVVGLGLPAGTYTVRLVGETEVASTRIVLVR